MVAGRVGARACKRAPSTLHIHAPASERVATDEQAVGVAVRADLRAHTRRLHHANPLNRRERIAVWAGMVIFLMTIAVSTALDKASTAVLVAGISQAIVVVGWVALWDPAQRVAGDIVPHYFLRKRYAELAEIELRFVWHEPPGDVSGHSRWLPSAPRAVSSAGRAPPLQGGSRRFEPVTAHLVI